MIAEKCEAPEGDNPGPPKDTAAPAVVQYHVQLEDSVSGSQAPPASAAQRGENESKNRPHLAECGEIICSVACSATGRETIFSRDAEGGTSAAMPGGQSCISLVDGSGCTQAREDISRRLRNEHDDDNVRRTSSFSTTFAEAGYFSLRRGGYEDASSVGSRRHERRRNPTSVPAGPPLPLSNPPLHLVRRTPRRETAPKLREACSTRDVENDAAHDGGDMVHDKDKDSGGRAWQAAPRASGSNRAALPPPVGSPPSALSHRGGVLKRRCGSPVRLHRGRRRNSGFDHGNGPESSGGSSGSSSGGSGGGDGNGGKKGSTRRSSNDFTHDRGCSSDKSSRSSRSSRRSRRSRRSRSSRSSRSSRGEGWKTYDVNNLDSVQDGSVRTSKRRDSMPSHDDEEGLYRTARKHSMGSGRQVRGVREVDRDRCARSRPKKVHGEEESDGSGVHSDQRRRRDNDGRRKQSREKLTRDSGEHRRSLQPQKRHARDKKAAESARRIVDDSCSTGRLDHHHADGYDDQKSDSSPTFAGGRIGPRRSTNIREKRHGSAEAQGSETTAIPSPRDPSGGSFGEIVVDSGSQRGLAWPAGPLGTAGTSSWASSGRDKARIQGLGDGGGGDRSGSFDSSGHRHSTSSSPTIKAPRRRGGKHLPPDLVYNDDDDDDGGDGSGDNVEFDVSSSGDSRSSSTGTADLPWSHDPSGVKEWLAEERVRREGRNTSLTLAHGNGDLACRVDTRRGSCNSSYKGKQTRHDNRSGDRLDNRRRDKPGRVASTGQDGSKRGDPGSSDGDERRCGGDADSDKGLKKLRGNIESRGTSSRLRASGGGWFTANGQVREEDRKLEVRDFDSSSDSNASSGRWRVKMGRRRGGNGADGGQGGEDDSGGDSGRCGDDGRGYCGALPPNERQKQCLSLMLAYERGKTSDLVQCVIVRDGREHQLMMVAQKCSKNRSSNYHVFDMHRGGFRTRLSKKNGNYLGKVRTNLKRTEATVFTNEQEVAELAAILFEKPSLVDHLREGSQPRKFSALLPALDCDGAPLAHKVDPYDDDSRMLSYINKGRHGSMFLLQTREPTFTKGNYRLNFGGRVTVPSVKNFQLVSPDDLRYTVCQFGKVGEDRFHLDYRAPINAFQAFCITLAQFNF